jgi:hypothetical protein
MAATSSILIHDGRRERGARRGHGRRSSIGDRRRAAGSVRPIPGTGVRHQRMAT